MTDRITKYLTLWMFTGVLLGVICGYYLPSVSLTLGFLGDLFLGGLKLLVIPMIVAGTISGVSAFGEVRRAGRFGGKVLGYFLGTLVIAVLIGLIAVLVIGPGRGVGGIGQAVTPSGWSTVSQALGGLIPGNLVQAVSEGKYLGVVLLALFLGGMLTAMGVKGRTAVTLFKNIHEGLLKVLALFLVVAPVGLFSLIGVAIAQNQSRLGDGMLVAGSYLLTVTLALLIHGFLLLPLAVWLLGHRSPFAFYRNLAPAFLTAFGTSNPMAAYPVTYRCLSERCQVDERATTLGLPLGSVINLQGTVICMVVATLFAAQIAHVEVGLLQYIGVAAMAVLLSIGAAGVPSAVLLASPVLFGIVGLSAEHIALATGVVISLDWLVDRMRAVVNLGGDAAVVAVLAESFDLKTARRVGRERRPSRTGRSPRPGDRDQRGPRSDPRSKGRRPERSERPVEPSRARGRRPAATGETPARTRGSRGRPAQSEPTPFQIKTSSAPALGAEGGPVPTRQPAAEPAAESDSSRAATPRRRTGRGGSPVGERRGRGRTRAPVDKPAGAGRSAPPAKPSEPEPAKSISSGPEPRKPEPATEGDRENNGRLSPAIVARELANVTAQLRQPEESETAEQPPVTDDSHIDPEVVQSESLPPAVVDDAQPDAGNAIEPIAEAPERAPEAKPEEEPATAFGRTKRRAGAAFRKEKAAATGQPEPSKPEAPQEQDEGVSPEPVEQAPKEPVEEAPKEPVAETPEPPVEEAPKEPVAETPEPPVEEPPEEPITFGRVKRKRTRK